MSSQVFINFLPYKTIEIKYSQIREKYEKKLTKTDSIRLNEIRLSFHVF